jgi:hypothetical protein
METPEEGYVDIDGHRVLADKADAFYNHDGTRVTDEQWDESKRRVAEAEALEGDDAITWQSIEDYEAGA